MMFSMLEVMPVLLGWRFHSSIFGIPPLPLLTITSCCFDATRLSQSNKLEFAQFGAHMQKLWQFWFPVEYSCFRGSGTAVVPLRGHKRQYHSAAVVPLVGPQP